MGHFKKHFINWKNQTGEKGPRAMTRFVILQFVDSLHLVAPNKYILKGGNLLWHYIKTPRSTVDVDFASESILDLNQVIADFKQVYVDGCVFKILSYKQNQKNEKVSILV